jgi:hypothetical protein
MEINACDRQSILKPCDLENFNYLRSKQPALNSLLHSDAWKARHLRCSLV